MGESTKSQEDRWFKSVYRFLKHARHRPAPVRLLCAFFWIGLGILTRSLLDSILGEQVPFAMLTVFVLIAAWGTGAWPAIVALAASVIVVDFLFLPPVREFGVHGLTQWLAVGSYLLPALFGILLIESLHRAGERVALQKAAAEAEAERRRVAEAELQEARRQLREYAIDLEAEVRTRTSELNESVGFLENFCYSIAHDLRAPLRAISGFSRVVAEDAAGRLTDDGMAGLHRIETATARMDKLITGLLEFGRISHVTANLRRVELGDVIRDTLSLLQPALQKTNASISLGDNLGFAWADPMLTRIVLRELIENAIYFAKSDQQLCLQIYGESQDNVTRIYVRDNGMGIPQEYKDKIFGLFHTLTGVSEDHPGIGLALVSKAMERMHGFVGVESRPGEGSTFWIDLPKHDWRPRLHPRPDNALKKETRRV